MQEDCFHDFPVHVLGTKTKLSSEVMKIRHPENQLTKGLVVSLEGAWISITSDFGWKSITAHIW